MLYMSSWGINVYVNQCVCMGGYFVKSQLYKNGSVIYMSCWGICVSESVCMCVCLD